MTHIQQASFQDESNTDLFVSLSKTDFNRFLFKSVWFPRLVPRHICVAEVSEDTSNEGGAESGSDVIVPLACQSLPVRRVEFWVPA